MFHTLNLISDPKAFVLYLKLEYYYLPYVVSNVEKMLNK